MPTIFVRDAGKAKALKSAVTEIEDAVSAMKKLQSDMQKTVSVPCGEKWSVFDVGSISDEAEILATLTSIEDKLSTLHSVVCNGYEALRDTDKSYKWKLRNRGWFSRTGGFSAGGPYGIIGGLFWNRQCSNTVTRTDVETTQSNDEIAESPKNAEPIEELNDYEKNIKAVMEEVIAYDRGNDGTKYWSWFYGYASSRTDGWCAVFVSYLMSKAGIDVNSPTGEYYNFKSLPNDQSSYFAAHDCYYSQKSGYIPKTGDLVFLDYNNDNYADHVGMIYVDDTEIYILHGNWSEQVSYSSLYNDYANDYQKICETVMGYGDTAKLYSYQNN